MYNCTCTMHYMIHFQLHKSMLSRSQITRVTQRWQKHVVFCIYSVKNACGSVMLMKFLTCAVNLVVQFRLIDRIITPKFKFRLLFMNNRLLWYFFDETPQRQHRIRSCITFHRTKLTTNTNFYKNKNRLHNLNWMERRCCCRLVDWMNGS